MRKGVVDDISHEGLRSLLREEGVSFQALKTLKVSNDPAFEAKKNRILELYAIADGRAQPKPSDPEVVLCYDEFGPLNLQPHPGKHWTTAGGGGQLPRGRRRATYIRPHGVRHLLAAYDLNTDKLYGHVKTRKGRIELLAFCRYLRTLYPPQVRIAIVLDNFSPHVAATVEQWAKDNNVELAYTPHHRQLAQPHRGAVHRPALLLPGRNRPREPSGPGPDDPPLHRLAKMPTPTTRSYVRS